MKVQAAILLLVSLLGASACSSTSTPRPVHPSDTTTPEITGSEPNNSLKSLGCDDLPGWTSFPFEHERPGAQFSVNGIFAFGPDGRIWHYPSDKATEKRPVGQGLYRGFSVSPTGNQLVGLSDGEVTVVDITTNQEVELPLVGVHHVMGWKPDSSSFFYLGQADDLFGIGEFHISTGTVKWLLRQGESDDIVVERLFRLPHGGEVAADGEQLILSSGHSGTGMIYRFDLQTGTLYDYPETSGNGFGVHWGPNGRDVYLGWGSLVQLNTESGEVRILDLPFELMIILDISLNGDFLVLGNVGDVSCRLIGRLP